MGVADSESKSFFEVVGKNVVRDGRGEMIRLFVTSYLIFCFINIIFDVLFVILEEEIFFFSGWSGAIIRRRRLNYCFIGYNC